MILRNYTPFRPLFFDVRDVQGRDFSVLVLRGTFDIIPGAPLRPNSKQQPIVETDIWHEEPNYSSMYMESDLAPFKPRTDIMVNAVAHAPGGRPLPAWIVRLEVGSITKSLRVTGPRAWVREGSSWKLEDPEPTAAVPLRYEYAFGGTWKSNWGEKHIYLENPIGKGFTKGDMPFTIDRLPAPQIESLDDPITEFGKPYVPEGFGPIARSWQPRLGRAGTLDEEWQRTRWPELPMDFEFSFYNAAHPDLICPDFLRGNEEVVLEGLSPEGSVRFYLPSYKMAALLRFKDGAMGVAPILLDTLFVDVITGTCHITWRSPIAQRDPIRVIEARMTVP